MTSAQSRCAATAPTTSQPAGTWSDDGALTLALLDSLITTHRFDPLDQARRFLRWADDGVYTPDGDGRFDIGNATATALANLRAGVAWAESGRTGSDDAGNGSLMRILPLALTGIQRTDATLVDAAHQACSITHADPRCQVACALYLLIARRLLEGEARDAVLDASVLQLQDLYAQAEEWQRLSPALALLLEHRITVRYGGGYVLDTFWSAWNALSDADDYRGTIERAVGYGGDTDTTAAVAGGLAGIHWGVAGILEEWLSALRGQDTVEPMLNTLLTSGIHTRLD